MFDGLFHVIGCLDCCIIINTATMLDSCSAKLDMGRMEVSALWMEYQRTLTSVTVPISRSQRLISVNLRF